jgi:hypothetical protein
LTNLIVFSYIVEQKGGKFEGYVEGDDGIFACNVHVTTEDYAKLGFDVKVERYQDPLEAGFCGIRCSEDLQIITDPIKKFSTFGWTSSFISAGPVIMHGLLRAKALSLCYEVPHCPILGVLARQALNFTRGFAPVFNTYVSRYKVEYPHDERGVVDFAPTLATRVRFEKSYGISIAVQLLAEKMIREGHLDHVADVIRASEPMMWYSRNYIN